MKKSGIYLALLPLLFLLTGISKCKPDIEIVGGFYSPSKPVEGQKMKINVIVRNPTFSAITNAKLSIFFEIGQVAIAPPSNQLPVVSLSGGSRDTVQFDWDVPAGWGNKTFRLFAETDMRNVIDEANENNNHFEFGKIRFASVIEPFQCQNNNLTVFQYNNKVRQCFDIRSNTLANIQSQLNSKTERVILYGDFAQIDCPVSLMSETYQYFVFFDSRQFAFQTGYLGIYNPIFDFKSPSINPWNLVAITVYDSKKDLEADCSPGANACSGSFGTWFIGIWEYHLKPHPYSVTGIQEGNTNYYFSQADPTDCHIIEYHEFQHVIDRLNLKPHPSWFEEMIARLFAEYKYFEPVLCPGITFTNIHKVENGQTTTLTEVPSLWDINSDLPLDNFANYYAGGDPCREAIIMQMNRGAAAGGKNYLQKLFKIMATNPINTEEEIANAILLSRDNDPSVLSFFRQKGCLK